MAGLPLYTIVKRARGWLYLRCPRCTQTFAVRGKAWATSWKGHGRACPYCFKPSKMPARRGEERSR